MTTEKRIPRVQIHEDTFSEAINSLSYQMEYDENGELKLKDYFIELVNTKGEINALFFIVDGRTRDMGCFMESKDLDSFIRHFDYWLQPNYQWLGIEFPDWFSIYMDSWRLPQVLKDARVSDIDEFDYECGSDLLFDIIKPDGVGPKESNLPALLLMAYGRLKHPYKLTKETRDNCELYIRGFIKRGYLFTERDWEGVLTTDYPGEIYDLFTFCADLYNDKVFFRDALLNTDWSNNYQRFINWDLGIFISIADLILGRENIDRFLDEAHAENKIELKLFLLDYKNKHFPVDG